MLKIDLNAISIPVDQRVWRLFPGSGYQFLDEFIRQGVGFLDAPAFPMPIDKKLSESTDLIPRVALSNSARELLYQLGPDTDADVLKLEDYQKARSSGARTSLANGLTSFLEVAKSGDVVILPQPIHMSRVWVGRFTSNRTRAGYYRSRYGETKIPARSIDWIAKIPENTISTELSEVLRHQHPFSLLERSRHLEVFALAFGSFVYGDRHVSTIYNDAADFLDSDAALLSTLSRLASAACEAVDGQKSLVTDDLLNLLLANPSIDYTCSQEADIHSPGFMRYISGTTVALVIAALAASLLVLAACNTKQEMAAKIATIEYVNASTSSDPQCTARVSAASKQVLQVLGTDRTWQLCEAARAARNRAKLRSSAKPIQ